MSIIDMFRPKAAPVADPSKTNVTVPGDGKEANNDGKAPAAFQKTEEGDKSPLGEYTKLWDTDPNAKPEPSMVPTFNVDPKKMMEAAATVDFTKTISPELLEKASKGDPQALAEAINKAAQMGYAQSAGATTKIVEKALADQAKVFQEQVMPNILRKHLTDQTLSTDTILNNPAMKPLVDAAKTQIAAKYPTANAAEIERHTLSYFDGFSSELMKSRGFTVTKAAELNADGSSTQLGAKQEDWGKFFGVEGTPQ